MTRTHKIWKTEDEATTWSYHQTRWKWPSSFFPSQDSSMEIHFTFAYHFSTCDLKLFNSGLDGHKNLFDFRIILSGSSINPHPAPVRARPTLYHWTVCPQPEMQQQHFIKYSPLVLKTNLLLISYPGKERALKSFCKEPALGSMLGDSG